MTAFFAYMNARRSELKVQNPESNMSVLSKMASEEWKKLSDAEKEKWKQVGIAESNKAGNPVPNFNGAMFGQQQMVGGSKRVDGVSPFGNIAASTAF